MPDPVELTTEVPKTESTSTTNESLVNSKPAEGEAKAEGTTAEETKKGTKTEFVPLTSSDLKFEDGVQVNEATTGEFLGILNNRDLSPAEQAQKLVDLQTKLAREASETGSKTWDEMQTKWQDEVRADPAIGGAKLESTLSNVAKLIDEHGSSELRAVMDLTGAGNNLHVIGFLNKISGLLSEGRPVSGTPTQAKGEPASRIFPSMPNP